MGGTRCVVYSVISRRLEHPSVIDQVESIPSQGSQRKRHWVVVFFFPLGFPHYLCTSHKGGKGWRALYLLTGMKTLNTFYVLL